MSAIRYGQACEPGGRPIKFGIETLGHTPPPTHKGCPGGETRPGVLGGWTCPCECHIKPAEKGSGT